LQITTYLAAGAAGAAGASGAAGAASLFAAGAAFLALCAFLTLCFIGAGAASVVLAASAAGAAGAAGAASAANAPMLKVAAKTPANNADNNLFISNFLNIKKVFFFQGKIVSATYEIKYRQSNLLQTYEQ